MRRFVTSMVEGGRLDVVSDHTLQRESTAQSMCPVIGSSGRRSDELENVLGSVRGDTGSTVSITNAETSRGVLENCIERQYQSPCIVVSQIPCEREGTVVEDPIDNTGTSTIMNQLTGTVLSNFQQINCDNTQLIRGVTKPDGQLDDINVDLFNSTDVGSNINSVNTSDYPSENVDTNDTMCLSITRIRAGPTARRLRNTTVTTSSPLVNDGYITDRINESANTDRQRSSIFVEKQNSSSTGLSNQFPWVRCNVANIVRQAAIERDSNTVYTQSANSIDNTESYSRARRHSIHVAAIPKRNSTEEQTVIPLSHRIWPVTDESRRHNSSRMSEGAPVVPSGRERSNAFLQRNLGDLPSPDILPSWIVNRRPNGRSGSLAPTTTAPSFNRFDASLICSSANDSIQDTTGNQIRERNSLTSPIAPINDCTMWTPDSVDTPTCSVKRDKKTSRSKTRSAVRASSVYNQPVVRRSLQNERDGRTNYMTSPLSSVGPNGLICSNMTITKTTNRQLVSSYPSTTAAAATQCDNISRISQVRTSLPTANTSMPFSLPPRTDNRIAYDQNVRSSENSQNTSSTVLETGPSHLLRNALQSTSTSLYAGSSILSNCRAVRPQLITTDDIARPVILMQTSDRISQPGSDDNNTVTEPIQQQPSVGSARTIYTTHRQPPLTPSVFTTSNPLAPSYGRIIQPSYNTQQFSSTTAVGNGARENSTTAVGNGARENSTFQSLPPVRSLNLRTVNNSTILPTSMNNYSHTQSPLVSLPRHTDELSFLTEQRQRHGRRSHHRQTSVLWDTSLTREGDTRRQESGSITSSNNRYQVYQVPDPTRTGIPQTVIDILPETTSSCISGTSEEQRMCLVCHTDYEMDDRLRRLPCLHQFHSQCIDVWLRNHATCPVCRTNVGAGMDSAELPDELRRILAEISEIPEERVNYNHLDDTIGESVHTQQTIDPPTVNGFDGSYPTEITEDSLSFEGHTHETRSRRRYVSPPPEGYPAIPPRRLLRFRPIPPSTRVEETIDGDLRLVQHRVAFSTPQSLEERRSPTSTNVARCYFSRNQHRERAATATRARAPTFHFPSSESMTAGATPRTEGSRRRRSGGATTPSNRRHCSSRRSRHLIGPARFGVEEASFSDSTHRISVVWDQTDESTDNRGMSDYSGIVRTRGDEAATDRNDVIRVCRQSHEHRERNHVLLTTQRAIQDTRPEVHEETVDSPITSSSRHMTMVNRTADDVEDGIVTFDIIEMPSSCECDIQNSSITNIQEEKKDGQSIQTDETHRVNSYADNGTHSCSAVPNSNDNVGFTSCSGSVTYRREDNHMQPTLLDDVYEDTGDTTSTTVSSMNGQSMRQVSNCLIGGQHNVNNSVDVINAAKQLAEDVVVVNGCAFLTSRRRGNSYNMSVTGDGSVCSRGDARPSRCIPEAADYAYRPALHCIKNKSRKTKQVYGNEGAIVNDVSNDITDTTSASSVLRPALFGMARVWLSLLNRLLSNFGRKRDEYDERNLRTTNSREDEDDEKQKNDSYDSTSSEQHFITIDKCTDNLCGNRSRENMIQVDQQKNDNICQYDEVADINREECGGSYLRGEIKRALIEELNDGINIDTNITPRRAASDGDLTRLQSRCIKDTTDTSSGSTLVTDSRSVNMCDEGASESRCKTHRSSGNASIMKDVAVSASVNDLKFNEMTDFDDTSNQKFNHIKQSNERECEDEKIVTAMSRETTASCPSDFYNCDCSNSSSYSSDDDILHVRST